MSDLDTAFHYFSNPVDHIPIPSRFTYPFNYEPSPLAIEAANELQHYLQTQTEWEHEFGLHTYVEDTNIGKMFGVLVVKNPKGELGFLAAFSGKLAGRNNLPYFVPPLFDALQEDGFYRKGEQEIIAINKNIIAIEQSDAYLTSKQQLETLKTQTETEAAQMRAQMKTSKKERQQKREYAAVHLQGDEYEKLIRELNHQSQDEHYNYKKLLRQNRKLIEEAATKLESFTNNIASLKQERRQLSAQLQNKLFDKYWFLNIHNESINVREIFKNIGEGIPPSGAGDCAAPKLLQHAFQQDYTPIAMAEFWWGQSPNSEIRKHGYFYPSCRSKCEPILGHMLKGMAIEDNPMMQRNYAAKTIDIIHEDDSIIVIHKPHDFLSVPGNTRLESVYDRIMHMYPYLEGPVMVHRLDMSTSGIMILARNTETYHDLQQQFLNKTVHKRYVALLDGELTQNEGIIDLPLRVDLDNRPRQLVCYEYGKTAVTKWETLAVENGQTRVHLYPVTGRTHQLRVHASHSKGLNTPIVGDDLYGKRADRLYLHAEYISFIHPKSGRKVSFTRKASF